MARVLAQTTMTLVRPAPTSLRGFATKVKVVEIDFSEEEDAPMPSSPVDQLGRIRRLEYAIHGLLVRRATPDWLPFVPGGSFWVAPPAPRSTAVADLISRMKTASRAEGAVGSGAFDIVDIDAPVNEEEAISFPLSMARGWPSVSYFLEGKFQHTRKNSPFEELSKKTWSGATQTDDEES